MIELVEYLKEDETSPFAEWLDRLDVQAALRVRRALARIELGNFGDSKNVGGGVAECRLAYGPGYRIYYGRDGDALVILLVGGTKKRQQKDIETAKIYWIDYKARKGT